MQQVSAVHDLSDGGLAVALAEMAMAGKIGAAVEAPAHLAAHGFWFGEDQARYIVTCAESHAADILSKAKTAGVSVTFLGKTAGKTLNLGRERPISVTDLAQAHEGFLPEYMAK